MSCEDCEYCTLNHAKPEDLRCFKYGGKPFITIKKMNKWAESNCDEPDSNKNRPKITNSASSRC